MRNKTIFLGLLFIFLLYSGCVFVVGGAVGALGGYAISKDTIQGEAGKSFGSIWNSSINVLNILGSVSKEDSKKGNIEAKIDTSNAIIKIEQLSSSTVRLRVSARRGMFPNLTLAQKIYTKIIENAK